MADSADKVVRFHGAGKGIETFLEALTQGGILYVYGACYTISFIHVV